MGNTNARRGAAQPGVEQSDDHPWGLKNITMPIPLEFARRLRNNKELQIEYVKFVTSKDYLWVPGFINNNEDKVYAKFHEQVKVPTLHLCRLDINGPRFTINKLLSDDDFAAQFMYINARGGMFYIPYVINTAPESYKNNLREKIKKHLENKYTCIFSDDVVLMAATRLQSDNNFPIHIPTNEIYPRGTVDQTDFKFGDIETESVPNNASDNALRAVRLFREYYNNYKDVAQENSKVVNLYYRFGDRQVINVQWVGHEGEHITTVIMERDAKRIDLVNFYILDSNGVDDCAAAIHQYFSDKLSLRPVDINVIRIMPYAANETPRAFQSISQGNFCQTWNIFSQILFMLNDATDINKLVYDEVLQHASPILHSSNSNERQVINVSLILLEFMFYIAHELFYNDFYDYVWNDNNSKEYLDKLHNFDVAALNYINSKIRPDEPINMDMFITDIIEIGL